MKNEPHAHPWQIAVLILSVFSLITVAFLGLGSLNPESRRVLEIADDLICIIFLGDFCWAFVRASNKKEYLKWGWLDLLSSIPASPWLRIGRLGRVIRLVRVLRIIRSLAGLRAVLDRSRATSAFIFVLTTSFVAVVVGALLVLEHEAGHDGSIQSGEDAIWWAFVTMTTVGYGDYFPVSLGGRMIAIVLMIFGIGLFGTFTGYIANWFEVPGEKEDQSRDEQILREIQLLRNEVAELKKDKGAGGNDLESTCLPSPSESSHEKT
ncbi:potassium channel family protein [Roseibacillus persicicus]|uniref:potassium channel family protein n=1 Tax=Roseibacillus persicicus TaxID=454148 RepID=UPI00398AF309